MESSTILLYLIESSVCMAMLYWIYKYILFRDTYFEWNRYFLLFAVIISLAYPLYHLPFSMVSRSLKTVEQDSLLMVNPLNKQTLLYIKNLRYYGSSNNIKSNLTILYNLLLIVWLSGILRYSIALFMQIRTIQKLKKTGQKYYEDRLTIVKCNSEFPAFSFVRTIFLNSKYDLLDKAEQYSILQHEKVHAKQLHTIDILFFEIVKIVFWFNPLIFFFMKTMKEVHEYIADSITTGNKVDKKYSNLILKMSTKANKSLLSNFSGNQLKARILMIMHPETNYLRKIRFLIALPLVLFMLLVFGITKDTVRDINNYNSNKALFTYPVKGKFKIIQPFYENKKITEFYKNKKIKKEYESFNVSHTQLSIAAEGEQEVVATCSGIVCKTTKIDNWGIDEYKVEIQHPDKFYSIYEHLYKVYISKGDTLYRGETIGTTGDTKLYPSINYKLLKNNKAVNPMDYFK